MGLTLRVGAELWVRFCAILTLPIIARQLGRDDYGLVVSTGAIVGLAATIGGLGLSFHVSRIVGRGETPAARQTLRSLILAALLSGTCAALALGISAPAIAAILSDHAQLGAALAIASVSVAAIGIDPILFNWLWQREQIKTLCILQVLTATIQSLGVALFAWLTRDPLVVMVWLTVCSLAKVGLLAVALRLTRRSTAAASQDQAPEFPTCLKDGFSITLGTIGGWGISNGARLQLGSATAWGGMGAAAAFGSLMTAVASACLLRLNPALVTAVAEKSEQKTGRALKQFTCDAQLLALPVICVGSLWGDAFLAQIAGPEFTGLGSTILVILASGCLELCALALCYVLIANGWASRTRNANLLGAAMAAGTGIFLVPALGLPGAAAATGLGQVGVIVGCCWALRHSPATLYALVPQPHWHAILGCALGTGIGMLIGSLTSLGPIPSITAFGATYAATLAVAARAAVKK